ncbi:hypothetical protein MLD38_024560 [Melastoma candidum]|uniref:Uncharacterized protein n=1 Tax=Melastoma candidum TaxID=119954 RepID=A0ACB9NSD4_9MYRT|nr:hypothetical protein MLD38_024560 [Melastoma candidum]
MGTEGDAEVVAVSSAVDCSFAPITPAKCLLEESRTGKGTPVESLFLSGNDGSSQAKQGPLETEDRTQSSVESEDEGLMIAGLCQEGTYGSSTSSAVDVLHHRQDSKQEGQSPPLAPSTPFQDSGDFNVPKVDSVISEKLRKKTPKKKRHKPKVVVEKKVRRRLNFSDVDGFQYAKPISMYREVDVHSEHGGCNDQTEISLIGPVNKEGKPVEDHCFEVQKVGKSRTRPRKRVRKCLCLKLMREITPVLQWKHTGHRTDDKKRKKMMSKVFYNDNGSPSWSYRWVFERSQCLVQSRIQRPNFPRYLRRIWINQGSLPQQQPCEQVNQSTDGTEISCDATQNELNKTSDSSVVPYDATQDKRKRKIMRPNINFELIAHRMCQQLLCDGSAEHGQLGDDMEWKWQKERELFRGRVDSFIARMHQFLGNRSFKPWAGSVIDSVVGVFLTQNVADYLSSSTFISLVAKFPIQSTNSVKEDAQMDRDEDVPDPRHGDAIGTQESKTDCQTNCDVTHLKSSGESLGNSEGDSQDQDEMSENDEDADKSPATKKKREDVIRKGKKEKVFTDATEWKRLREIYSVIGPRPFEQTDSADWEALLRMDFNDIATPIQSRGQHHILAIRIQDFLEKIAKIHGDLDLEWLRHCPPEIARQYLIEVEGLGLKSVECVLLLALQHIAFPVDTHVSRIAVRLGWVPLQPLPGDLQIHLLEEYPVLNHIQQYLWPRLKVLGHKTLYELHYQLITFGKVFCSKKNPNCKECPMKGECKHYASAAASAKFALPASANDGAGTSTMPASIDGCASTAEFALPAPVNDCEGTTTIPTSLDEILGPDWKPEPLSAFENDDNQLFKIEPHTSTCQPTIEEPPSPDRASCEMPVKDIEDFCYGHDDSEEILTLDLTGGTSMFLNHSPWNPVVTHGDSRALVTVTPEFASMPRKQMKYYAGLRTEHCVYELPDSHPLLREMDVREADDPSPYLLLVWTPDVKNTPKPHSKSSKSASLAETSTDKDFEQYCDSHTVLGTILIPCRTAMRARFPLNGTYFQVNEVFADHKSTQNPMTVPRYLIWDLPKRTVYCGKHTGSILRGLSAERIQECFWRGFICSRGFDRRTRTPRPLSPRFHWTK